MAEVFEAELVGDRGFVRKVALKRMLESAAADEVAARRFLDEATIASRLHHANVVSVVDLGTLDDRPFQVLEFVDGIDAHRLLQRVGGTLPVEVALAIANEVAHALDHAHTAVDSVGLPLGIVHRDVKPSNVLVSWSGDVKLGDFGIAVAHERAAATETGVVAGTLGFIAPEQRARGTLDGRTDVFALGLTLHALLVGRSPLADIAIEMRSLVGEPVPIDASIPDDVRALLARTLALARTDRPTAGELATQIGSALASRLTGDRRNVLRAFLATHAPATTRPRGALDALLGIEVVMTGSAGEVRRYETRAAPPKSDVAPTLLDTEPTTARRDDTPPARDAAPARDDATPAHDGATPARGAAPLARDAAPPARDAAPLARDAARHETASTASTSEMPTPTRRRLGPLLAVAGVLAIAGGLAAWRSRSSTAPIDAAIVASAPDAAAPSPDAVATPSTDTELVANDSAESQPLIDAVPVVVPPADAKLAKPPKPDARTTVDAAVPIDDAAPAIGYIAVLGREDLIGAAVLIDGKLAGSVPNLIPVTIGKHRVEIEKKDGTRLQARIVEVTPIHNRANPVRPTW